MTIGEFKAWLAGYLESCSAAPAKRVKRIEEKLVEVREHPISVPYPVYTDRYIYPRPWVSPTWTWQVTGTSASNTNWMVTDDRITTCEGTTTIGYLNTGGENGAEG